MSSPCSERWKTVRNSSRDLVALPAKARERAEYMLSGEKNKSEFVPSNIKRSVTSQGNVHLELRVLGRHHERIPQKKILGSNDIRIVGSHTKHVFNTDCTSKWRIVG